jgi:hypothetical protein
MTGPVIYNVTTTVSPAIEQAWLQWMLDTHIAEVLGTGCFYKHQLVKILEIDDTEGATYAIQYFAKSIASYHEYIVNYANAFRGEINDRWGDQVLSFRTLMGIVQ